MTHQQKTNRSYETVDPPPIPIAGMSADGNLLDPPKRIAVRALDYQSPLPIEYAPVDLSFPGWLYIFRVFGIILLIFLLLFACFAVTVAVFD